MEVNKLNHGQKSPLYCFVPVFNEQPFRHKHKVIFINLDKQNLISLLCNFWINTCTVRREMIHSSAVSNRWKFEFAIFLGSPTGTQCSRQAFSKIAICCSQKKTGKLWSWLERELENWAHKYTEAKKESRRKEYHVLTFSKHQAVECEFCLFVCLWKLECHFSSFWKLCMRRLTKVW